MGKWFNVLLMLAPGLTLLARSFGLPVDQVIQDVSILLGTVGGAGSAVSDPILKK